MIKCKLDTAAGSIDAWSSVDLVEVSDEPVACQLTSF